MNTYLSAIWDIVDLPSKSAMPSIGLDSEIACLTKIAAPRVFHFEVFLAIGVAISSHQNCVVIAVSSIKKRMWSARHKNTAKKPLTCILDRHC